LAGAIDGRSQKNPPLMGGNWVVAFRGDARFFCDQLLLGTRGWGADEKRGVVRAAPTGCVWRVLGSTLASAVLTGRKTAVGIFAGRRRGGGG